MRLKLGMGLGSGGATADPYALPAGMDPLFWLNPGKGGDGSSLTDFGSLGVNATQGTADNQPAINPTGMGGLPTADFDGTNDAMASVAVDLSAYTALTVFIVRERRAAGTSVLLELSANASSNNGSFYIAENLGAAGDLEFELRGSAAGALRSGVLADTGIIVAAFDFSGTSVLEDIPVRRYNGADLSVTQSGSHPGDGPFAASQPLNVGARNGASLFTGSRVSELVVCGGIVASEVIAAYEASRAARYEISI